MTTGLILTVIEEEEDEEHYRVNDILSTLQDAFPEYSDEDLRYFLVKLVKQLKKEKTTI